MYTRLPHPMSRPASGCSHPVHQTVAFSDRRTTAQRLVLKYGGGDKDSIDENSQIIAKAQDATRSRPVIPVQNLFHIDDSIYPLMGEEEPIYIVSHGRAAIGSFPAVLEQGAHPSDKPKTSLRKKGLRLPVKKVLIHPRPRYNPLAPALAVNSASKIFPFEPNDPACGACTFPLALSTGQPLWETGGKATGKRETKKLLLHFFPSEIKKYSRLTLSLQSEDRGCPGLNE